MPEIETSVVDEPPTNKSGPKSTIWTDVFDEARRVAPKWVRVGPYRRASSAATAKDAARRDGGSFNIVQRRQDGAHWVFVQSAEEVAG